MVSASSWSWVTITVALDRPLQHLLDLAAHLLAQLDVEARQRLVEQEAVGIAHDRPADRDALLLALGEPAGDAVEHLGQVERARDPVDAGRRSRPSAEPLGLQRKGQVLAHGQARVERVELEHHGDVALATGASSLTRRPPTMMSPEVAVSSPAIIRSVVVLPQPEGPSRQTTSPAPTSRSTASTARQLAEALGDLLQG